MSNMNVQMNDILKELGLQELIDPFRRNDITPSVVVDLKEEDFSSLGITSIGDRVRLRERCRDFLRDTDIEGSPVVKRLKRLMTERNVTGHRFSSKNNRKVKDTRRVTIGWKHFFKGIFKQVTANKGGGRLDIDLGRHLNLKETTDIFVNRFFPNGRNSSNNLDLQDVDYFVATFTGQPVSEIVTDATFTFGLLVETLATSPLRLYLHTKIKAENDRITSESTATESTTPDTPELSLTTTTTRVVVSPPVNTAASTSVVSLPVNTAASTSVVSLPVNTAANTLVVSLPVNTTTSTSVVSPPLNTAASTSMVSPPVNTATSNSVVSPPVNTAASTSVVSLPVNTATSNSVVPPPVNTATSTLVVSPPMNTATSTSVVSPPVNTAASTSVVSPPVTQTTVVQSVGPSVVEQTTTAQSSADTLFSDVEDTLPDIADDSLVESLLDMDVYESADSPEVFFRSADTARQNRLSLRRRRFFENGPSDLTLEGIIKWWRSQSDIKEDERMFVVDRTNLLKSSLRIFKREDFSFYQPPKIVFSGEESEDFGGPRREFFRLLMKAVEEDIMQGQDGKFFMHDIAKLSNKTYELSGSLVAYSILHGGPGLSVFHEALFEYITNQTPKELPSLLELNCDIKQKLGEIEQTDNQQAYAVALDGISDWCADQGLTTRPYRMIEDRKKLMNLLISNEIFYRVQCEISQFQNGLNKVGAFYEKMLLCPDVFRPLFTRTKSKLTFPTIRGIYQVNYSPNGSNKRTNENRTIYCLEAFLADTEGGNTGVTLHDVLAFWTGASDIPPLGFEKKLEISFMRGDRKLPCAHTCGMVLDLWDGYSDPDDFEQNMVMAIQYGGGFHLV